MRPQRKLLIGSTNEKFDRIEKYLHYLKRKQANYVIGVTPPIPVFDYCSVPEPGTGMVFRKLMPGNGKITVGCMWVDELDRKLNPQAVLTVDGPMGGGHVKIPIQRQATSVQPNMDIEFGQRLSLAIEPVEACKGIWTAFLFEVETRQLSRDQQMLDGFLELVEQADEDLENA